MNLNELLLHENIDVQEQKVLLLRHAPKELRELKKDLRRLAQQEPEVFNAYQQTQTKSVEEQMEDAKYVAAFVGHGGKKALFVGLYSVDGAKPITPKEYWEIPANVELKKRYGVEGFTEQSSRSSMLWFDLVPARSCVHWRDKLIVRWSGGDRNWHCFADEREMLVLSDKSELEREQDTIGNESDGVDDTFDDMPGLDYSLLGSDGAPVENTARSGVKRDPRVRKAVLQRAKGKCEREGCGATRSYNGFLDVHHILGAHSSDRVWNCAALCPNCHREAHAAPDRDRINENLLVFATRFKNCT